MTYNDVAQIVLQSILVTIEESAAYAEISQILDRLGLDVDIHINVTIKRSAELDSATSADAKFLQDMHISPGVVPVASAPKATETPAAMPTTFTWWLLQKIANRLKRKGLTR